MIFITQVPYYVWFMSRNFQTCLSWAPLAIPPKVSPCHYSCKLSNLVLYLIKKFSKWNLSILSLFLVSAH